jgi:hypothetical protein
MTENISRVPNVPQVPQVVCDLSGAPDTAEERLREYARLFDTAFVSRERSADVVRWRLRARAGVEAWAHDLARRENACCAFITNRVRVEGDEVVWEATTIDDPAARAVLDLFCELPVHGWQDETAVRAGSARAAALHIVESARGDR